jgi:hypothetical protein
MNISTVIFFCFKKLEKIIVRAGSGIDILLCKDRIET